MVTGTKSSAGGKLATFVTLIVLLGFGYGLIKYRISDDNVGVTFTVVFVPENRVAHVEIAVFLDGAVAYADKTKESPWELFILVGKGQTVSLVAKQSVPAKLSCAVNGEVQETTEHPGIVTCLHKRV